MKDYRINFQLPAQPLGEALKPEKPVKVCEFREFETKVYGAAERRPCGPENTARDEKPAAPPQSKWTPKVGDRVRWTICSSWNDCIVTDTCEAEAFVTWAGTEGMIPIDELEPISTSSDSDGWVEHDGKGRPSAVNSMTRVCIKWRDGMTLDGVSAGGWSGWFHGEHGPQHDIVAYRVLP